jgi:hypothetical protein
MLSLVAVSNESCICVLGVSILPLVAVSNESFICVKCIDFASGSCLKPVMY